MLRINGRAVATAVRAETKKLLAKLPRPAGLAIVQVGDDPASTLYVGLKKKAAEELGMHFVQRHFPVTATQADVLAVIDEYSEDASIDGVVVQLPLPTTFDVRAVLAAIPHDKDVDGIGPEFQEQVRSGTPTPWQPALLASMDALLAVANKPQPGDHAVVFAKSVEFRETVTAFFSRRGVTIESAETVVPELLQGADIVLTALGKPHILHEESCKKGATIIDCGIATLDGRTVGDFAGDEGRQVVAAFSPVPGGVGPVTVAQLLKNAATAAQLHLQQI